MSEFVRKCKKAIYLWDSSVVFQSIPEPQREEFVIKGTYYSTNIYS